MSEVDEFETEVDQLGLDEEFEDNEEEFDEWFSKDNVFFFFFYL